MERLDEDRVACHQYCNLFIAGWNIVTATGSVLG